MYENLATAPSDKKRSGLASQISRHAIAFGVDAETGRAAKWEERFLSLSLCLVVALRRFINMKMRVTERKIKLSKDMILLCAKSLMRTSTDRNRILALEM